MRTCGKYAVVAQGPGHPTSHVLACVRGCVPACVVARVRPRFNGGVPLRSTESVLLEATRVAEPPRFDPLSAVPPESIDDMQFSLFLQMWENLDLSAIPGFPSWEEAVFEILLPVTAPLLSIFAHYCRSSLSSESLEGASCHIAPDGWERFVVDCNVVTKSFSMERIVEVRSVSFGSVQFTYTASSPLSLTDKVTCEFSLFVGQCIIHGPWRP